MRKFGWLAAVIIFPLLGQAQSVTRYVYYDAAKKNIKEIYQVRDTIQNILQGRYISYFLNGNMDSKGQFMNNETTGLWEFYYETGNPRMKGILRQGSNYGTWEYFFENGVKSMEGTVSGRNREGEWKIYYESGELKEKGDFVADKRSGLWDTYFEDGTRRGEIEYVDDHGRFTEYYHSGKIFAEGPRSGAKNVGHWRYFAEDGTLQSEGDYVNGKKSGEWKHYYATGKVSSAGFYENDESVGQWKYYFEDGTVSSTGEFIKGMKNGYWSTFSRDGSIKSEITYLNGTGDYREYYPDKKLKAKGQIVKGTYDGKWQYFSSDGKLEGECDFVNGKGLYKGYYPSGTLQTKGMMEDDLRVGTWELYEQDGTLSGYYKPFYENNQLASEINALINKTKNAPQPINRNARKQGFYYFQPRFPEYHSVIIAGNPMLSFIGRMPLAIEFYNEQRLGHEFEFEGIRSPFFTSDSEVPAGKTFQRGYSIALKQKFYNTINTGMWYFGHEVRFTNIGYFNNMTFSGSPNNIITASASEQRAEYGVMIGTRLMQKNDGDGFTIDAVVGYNIGYRMFDVEPVFQEVFSGLNHNAFSQSVRFGLNFGYSFSFDGRR
ncbi:MAG: toxin-antitoxin system YwqK family antitoxin [Cyclobacteriaceae bacterium]|nr:toxin-antitoxin system YwqK family antitoxin [Cyclobacteriaceae bacterium]